MNTFIRALTLVMVGMLTGQAWGQTVLFRQDFASSAVVGSYVSATPNIGQFTSLSTTGPNATVSINVGRLRMASLGGTGSTAFFNRTANFYSSGSPAFLLIQFDFEVIAAGASGTSAATFYVGSGFPDNASIIANADVYARLGFNLINNSTNFALRDIGPANNSSALSGRQRITLALNNSGASVQYFTPASSRRNLPNDQFDVWANNTLIFSQISPTTPTQNLNQIRFTFQNDNSTIQLDSFLISDDLNILPVSLRSFGGWATVGQHQLEWKTASPCPGTIFEVQRSGAAGAGFVGLGQVIAQSSTQYGWLDAAPLQGYNYYRLRILPPDGQETYSPMISVLATEGEATLQLAPNPASDKLLVRWSGSPVGTLCVDDLAGRTLLTQPLAGPSTQLDLLTLAPGTYFIHLRTRQGHQTKKFVKE
jgi:hypothetical protein